MLKKHGMWYTRVYKVTKCYETENQQRTNKDNNACPNGDLKGFKVIVLSLTTCGFILRVFGF